MTVIVFLLSVSITNRFRSHIEDEDVAVAVFTLIGYVIYDVYEKRFFLIGFLTFIAGTSLITGIIK